ncbi:MAG: glycoside hydrolase family 65 protein, partial [Cytophagales bacterium]|nr:glycoside hydrolase family 65 protein [Cytophagales bacterium]
MKNWLVILLAGSGTLFAQDFKSSPWHIQAENINPNNYYGITVANGMVGLISSPEPMKMKDVVLNGIYDNYQRGRVSNILKTFNHVNLDLDVDKIR